MVKKEALKSIIPLFLGATTGTLTAPLLKKFYDPNVPLPIIPIEYQKLHFVAPLIGGPLMIATGAYTRRSSGLSTFLLSAGACMLASCIAEVVVNMNMNLRLNTRPGAVIRPSHARSQHSGKEMLQLRRHAGPSAPSFREQLGATRQPPGVIIHGRSMDRPPKPTAFTSKIIRA